VGAGLGANARCRRRTVVVDDVVVIIHMHVWTRVQHPPTVPPTVVLTTRCDEERQEGVCR
jgi:hypothetical protein